MTTPYICLRCKKPVFPNVPSCPFCDWGTLDDDGYPTEEALRRIKEWSWQDHEGLICFVFGLWNYAEWGWTREGNVLRISTGGWSGNEDIIEALQETFFWRLYWHSSLRGGHYEFHLP